LFHLDGIPAFFQAEFAFLLLARGGTVAARRQTAAIFLSLFSDGGALPRRRYAK
jgi:hypothetical protein